MDQRFNSGRWNGGSGNPICSDLDGYLTDDTDTQNEQINDYVDRLDSSRVSK